VTLTALATALYGRVQGFSGLNIEGQLFACHLSFPLIPFTLFRDMSIPNRQDIGLAG
jgi:hypothetical protein